MKFEVLIGSQVILDKHPNCEGSDQLDGGTSHLVPTHYHKVDSMNPVCNCTIDRYPGFPGAHETNAQPAFGIFYQFAKYPGFYSCCICFCIVVAKVADAHIVLHRGIHIPHVFIIGFCLQFKKAGRPIL